MAATAMGAKEAKAATGGGTEGVEVAWARAEQVAAVMEAAATVAVEEEAKAAAGVGGIEGT